jgi:hypothetical protein
MTVTWHTQRVKGASQRVPRDQGNGCQRSLGSKYLAHQLPLGKSNMAGKSIEIPLKMGIWKIIDELGMFQPCLITR